MNRVRESIMGIRSSSKNPLKKLQIPADLEQHTSPNGDNKTPNRIVLKKSKVVLFKDKQSQGNYSSVVSKQIGMVSDAKTRSESTGGSKMIRSVSYQIEQIKNLRNMKALGENSGSGSGSGSGQSNDVSGKNGSSGNSNNEELALLHAIIKPQ